MEANRSGAAARATASALTLALLLASAMATAVPTSDPRDPPAPPTGFGRLFGGEGQHVVRNCSITSQTATQAVVGFTNSFPHILVSYVQSGGARTTWSALPSGATSYDCTTVSGCLHAVSEVHIRGCNAASCAGEPVVSCTVSIGLPVNGPPDVTWGGIESLQVGMVGCAESDATEFVARLRFAGSAPSTGYPTIGGTTATEREIERVTSGSINERTYTVSTPWTAANVAAGYYDFTVALDGSGSRESTARVALGEHCLAAPQAQVVASGGTLTPIGAGSIFVTGTELEVQSSNGLRSLTGQQLMHNGAPSAFGRTTPAGAPGTDTPHTWHETATARDGLTYTSPELPLTAQAMVCVSDSALVAWWMDNSDNIDLPDSTDWVPGPTIRTNACPGVSPPPAPSGNRSVSDARVGTGSVATGWPTEVRALNATGQITELYFWYAGGWDNSGSDWYFYAKRNLTCPDPGERIVGNSCQTCPTYDECSGGTLTTKTWCNDGNPPLDDRRVSHQSCVSNATVTEWACLNAGDSDPADQPCVVVCGPGERDGGGFCEPCPTYQACDASGNLSTQTWCNAGNPPGSAQIVNHQACQSGSTVTQQACVAAGGSPPANDPCLPTCQANERLVSGVCQPCPSYSVCTSGDRLSTRYWCEAGSPPSDAEMVDVQACRDQFRPITLSRCWDGDRYTPTDSPCSNSADPDCPMGERMDRGRCRACPRIQVCAEGIPGSTTYIDWCWPGDPPPDVGDDGCGTAEPSCPPTTMPACAEGTSYAWNSGSCMWNELTRNPPRCPSTSGVSYWDEAGCRYRCGTDPDTNPPPPPPPPPPPGGIETYCDSNGNAQTRPSGSSQNVNNLDEASDCTSGETLNGNSCCVACPQTARPACTAGRSYTWDANQCRWIRSTVSRPSCGGQTATWDSGSCSWDCPNLGTESYCDSNGVAQERPASGSSDVDNLDKASDCTSRQMLNSDSCCVSRGTQTYEACSNGVLTTQPWTASGNPVDDDTATRYYCLGASARTATICGSTDDDDKPDSCGSGYSLNSVDCCEQDQTYQACSNGVLTTQPWTGSGNPVDDDTATRYYCVGASARTATICGSTDDDDKPDSCRTGFSLNTGGCCAPDTEPQTYQACSDGVLTTKPWTGSGNPVDDDTATRYYCVGASARTATICGSTDDDDKPDSCRTGYSLNSVDCCEQDQTYQACSNGVLTTKPWTPSGNPVDDPVATRYFCIGATPDDELICASSDRDDRPNSCGSGYSLNDDDCCEPDVVPPIPPPTNGTEKYCDSNGVAKERTAPGTEDEDNLDKASDCTSRQILNSDSCCVPRGTKYYCDSNGVAQESLAPGIADVNNLDKASDCTSGQTLNNDSCCVDPPPRGIESYCDSNGVAREREAPGTDNVNNLDKASDCDDGESLNSDSCCAVCPPTRKPYCSEGQDWAWSTTDCEWQKADVSPGACYNSGGLSYVYDTWLSTSCSYSTTSSVDLEPTAGTCETVDWSTASCGWVTTDNTPTDPGGCPGQGQAWDLQGCEYVVVNVPPITCSGTLEWDLCRWKCIILDIQFSFPSLISEQTLRAATEQNLDVLFNGDGSITLVETLVGPNSSSTTSLGNWATGRDVARASEVVEYRLAGNNGGQCTGSSSWAAFSGLTVGVFGEAAVGEASASCSYAFRYADGGASIGSTLIQVSTQASSGPGLPGQMN